MGASRMQVPGGSSGAPADAEYIVAAAHAGLSAGRIAVDSSEIDWNFTVAGQVTLDLVAVPWAKLTGVPGTFPPSAHASSHENGGTDEISVAGLSGELADSQKVTVRKNSGANVGARARLNFIEGANITLAVADDAGGGEVDITITGTGGGSGTDEVLLVPIANKTIPANSSIIVGDYYQLDAGINLTIEAGANLTIT